MATLTIDLPEAPRTQAAYRLAAACPHCGVPLVLRQNRQTGALFTGCSAYPGCAFREPHDGYGKELCNFPDGTDNWLISGRLL
jgi:ssDNA-binding Zn-finger/Zn-ribbon topoisomerase 1